MHVDKHSSSDDAQVVKRALTHVAAQKEPEKPKREMHVKEMHSGGYHVVRHDGEGNTTEHAVPDVDGVHDHIHEHFSGAGE